MNYFNVCRSPPDHLIITAQILSQMMFVIIHIFWLNFCKVGGSRNAAEIILKLFINIWDPTFPHDPALGDSGEWVRSLSNWHYGGQYNFNHLIRSLCVCQMSMLSWPQFIDKNLELHQSVHHCQAFSGSVFRASAMWT